MFEQAEHEALMRLMRHAKGYVPDSRRIAHWLQHWEQVSNPRKVKTQVAGLAVDHSRDVRTVAKAAKRTGKQPSKLGREEYLYDMENISRAHPLKGLECER